MWYYIVDVFTIDLVLQEKKILLVVFTSENGCLKVGIMTYDCPRLCIKDVPSHSFRIDFWRFMSSYSGAIGRISQSIAKTSVHHEPYNACCQFLGGRRVECLSQNENNFMATLRWLIPMMCVVFLWFLLTKEFLNLTSIHNVSGLLVKSRILFVTFSVAIVSDESC